MTSHAESLDGEAGVILGFAGVVVGLGATAGSRIGDEVVFQAGLILAVMAALFAALAFLLRRFPVLEVARLRESNLMTSADATRLDLLDTEILMVEQISDLVRQKGLGVRLAVVCLAVATGLVVIGTLMAITGGGFV